MAMGEVAQSLGIKINQDKQGGAEKSDATKKKSDPDKSTALKFADGEAGAQELMEAYSEKSSGLTSTQNQSKLQQKMQKEMESSVQEFFQDTEAESSHDVVKLSTAVIMNKSEDLKKKELGKKEDQQEAQEAESDQSDPARLEGKTRNASAQVGGDKQAKAQKKQADLKAEIGQHYEAQGDGEENSRETLKKYASAFSENIVKKSPQKKAELEQLRQRLQREGMPSKKVAELEGRLRHVMGQDLKKQIKDGFLKYALTYSPGAPTSEYLHSADHVKSLLNMANVSNIFAEDGEKVLEQSRIQVKSDMRSFMTEELELGISTRMTAGASEEEIFGFFNKFNDLSKLCEFDSNQFMGDWMKKMDDVGLKYFMNPTSEGFVDSETEGEGRPKHHSQEQADEDSDLLEDQLRLLFMQQTIKTDLRSMIDIGFKIRKLKNGMKRLGIYRENLVKKLEEEGKGLARLKFTEMLKEALEERATLSELKGPAFQLVDNKMKTALKGLAKMGTPMPKDELKSLRDQVNRALFSITKEEYIRLEIKIDMEPNNRSLVTKRKTYLAILERLKEESKIAEDIRPKLFQDMNFSSDTKVIEAA